MTESILKRELVLIKLGGSIITDKAKKFTARKGNILRLAREIANSSFQGKIIIGHGAGSFAHTPAKKYKTKEGLINKDSLLGMSIVEDAARGLNAIIIKEFLNQKLPVFSFSPASFIISDAKSFSKSYLDPIKHALRVGTLPIVYGDVIMDKNKGCTIFSTEKVLSILATELRKDYKIRIILVTDVNGVYNEKGNTIPRITSTNFTSIKNSILGAKGVDVTGGMLHKVEESLILARTGIKTLIINGNKKGGLTDAILKIENPESTLIS